MATYHDKLVVGSKFVWLSGC